MDRDGYDQNDIIATSPNGRGSFLDLIDDNGIDFSSATINRTVRELGSGPLHSILRLEGEYVYSRSDNRKSPFIIRIHIYAGKPFIKVLTPASTAALNGGKTMLCNVFNPISTVL